jgi:hypothetical protein
MITNRGKNVYNKHRSTYTSTYPHISIMMVYLNCSCPSPFTPGTHWIGGWVGSRTDLDDVTHVYIQ